MFGRIFGCLFLAFMACMPLHAQEANIGVLAYRGEQQLEQKWSSLKAYLDESVQGWQFTLVPITLKSASKRIDSGDLHFVLTNPGHFSVLDRHYRMSVIASRQRSASDGTYVNQFGSVIFARKDAGIAVLQDVVGKSVVAIDREAFGGFQLAWREFQDVGVDLFHDTKQLTYVGFPMDQVFQRVQSGAADVGIARSGLIETMSLAGTLDPTEFVVLNQNATYGHPELLSTRLYPEWPFAALAATPKELRDAVAVALLMAGSSEDARRLGMTDVWSSPMPYHDARELTAAFHDRVNNGAKGSLWITHPWGLAAIFAAMVMLLSVIWTQRNGRRNRPKSPVVEAKLEVAVETATDDVPESNTLDDHHVTPREREVLDLISQGFSTKEIGRELGISPKTVEFHRSNLLRKYDARTSSQLIALST